MLVKKNFSIALDIKRTTSNREFEVVEGDNGNVLEVTLTDGGEAIDLSGCRVSAVFSTGSRTAQQDNNGHGITVESGNVVTIELYTTSFSPGMVECELQVFSGEEQETLVTSAKFNFTCRRGIGNADTVQSTPEWPLLVDTLKRVEDVEEALPVLVGEVAELNAATVEATAYANAAAESAAEMETAVQTAETLRVAAEQGRVHAEETRADKEAERQASEQNRQVEEQNRQTNTAAAIASTDAATDRANTAA